MKGKLETGLIADMKDKERLSELTQPVNCPMCGYTACYDSSYDTEVSDRVNCPGCGKKFRLPETFGLDNFIEHPKYCIKTAGPFTIKKLVLHTFTKGLGNPVFDYFGVKVPVPADYRYIAVDTQDLLFIYKTVPIPAVKEGGVLWTWESQPDCIIAGEVDYIGDWTGSICRVYHKTKRCVPVGFTATSDKDLTGREKKR